MNNSSTTYHPCPSEDTLNRYVKGELSRAESRTVEMHLLECEMCRDYVDALFLMQEQDIDLQSVVSEIDAMVDEKIQSKTSKIVFFKTKNFLKLAAVLLLLVGITIILRINFQQKPDNSILAENKNDSILQRYKSEVNEDHAKIKSSEQNEIVGKSDLENPTQSFDTRNAAIIEDFDPENSKIAENPKSVADANNIQRNETYLKVIETGAEGSKEIAPPAVEEAMVIDNVKDDSETIEREVSYSAESDNLAGKIVSETKHEKAKRVKSDKKSEQKSEPHMKVSEEMEDISISQWYWAKEYDKILKLSNLNEMNDTNYTVIYYKSLVYIQLKEFLKAKGLLEQLAKQNNSYKKEAQNLLKSEIFD